MVDLLVGCSVLCCGSDEERILEEMQSAYIELSETCLLREYHCEQGLFAGVTALRVSRRCVGRIRSAEQTLLVKEMKTGIAYLGRYRGNGVGLRIPVHTTTSDMTSRGRVQGANLVSCSRMSKHFPMKQGSSEIAVLGRHVASSLISGENSKPTTTRHQAYGRQF